MIQGVIKNNILSCFNFQLKTMKIYKDKFINTLLAKSTQVNERLKRIHEAFHVENYFKLKPIECKITYLLYIF